MQCLIENKKSEKDILKNDLDIYLTYPAINKESNNLLLGENLIVLKALLYHYDMGGKIDLIYIDPPFSTRNVFKTSETRANTISHYSNGAIAYEDTLTGDAFLEFLRERLVLARELLSDRGSIYLHIDYKIGHYVKVLMDEIFGIENFRNDITRIKCNPKNFSRKAYGNIKDLILFYSKTQNNIWNECYVDYTASDIAQLFRKSKGGRAYTTIPLHAPGETKNGETGKAFRGIFPPEGRHWRCSIEELEKLDSQGLIEWSKNGVPRKIIYADSQKGKKAQDIWEFKDPQYPAYPTEKNSALLERIISTSSDKDSTVMDFFCGSGTTLVASQRLSRKWIGIDRSKQAIETVKRKLESEEILGQKQFEFFDLSGLHA
ncbi:MAG: site-specific DNA-methyltransferase [Burkholderiales bacterium]|nr:site-specific DNA-methyltransferase [Burkholderiales bacterium]